EVAEVTVHRLLIAVERFLVAPELTGEADDRPVGLELRERLLEQLSRVVPAERSDEVDGHVVRRPEAGPERVGAGRREPGDVRRVETGRPQHDAVALDVDAAPAGAAGELGVLPR